MSISHGQSFHAVQPLSRKKQKECTEIKLEYVCHNHTDVDAKNDSEKEGKGKTAR